MTNWFNQLLVWGVALATNLSMIFGMKGMHVEGIFGWRSTVADLSVVMTIE